MKSEPTKPARPNAPGTEMGAGGDKGGWGVAQAELGTGEGAAVATQTSPGSGDCWNEIGVTGNGTCAELAKYIHCRNCPVFSAGALRLLDREASGEYRRYWTEHFGAGKGAKEAGKLSLLIFRIGGEWFGLRTEVMEEVAEKRVIHSLPTRRGVGVLGLANIRGELVVCVTLRGLVGQEREERKERSRVIYERLLVVRWEGRRLAFPVEEVGGIHHGAVAEMKEAPATVLKAGATYTRGVVAWRGKSVGCLDEELVFTNLNRNLA